MEHCRHHFVERSLQKVNYRKTICENKKWKGRCGKEIAEGFLLQKGCCGKAIVEAFILRKGNCGRL